MNLSLFSTITAFIYLGITAYQSRRLWNHRLPNKASLYCLGLTALVCHGWILYRLIDTPVGHDLSLWNMASFFTWLMALLVYLSSLTNPAENLFLFAMPLAALSLLLPQWLPVTHNLHRLLSIPEVFHIFTSMIAFSVLGISALQAMLVFHQHNNLRNIRSSRLSLLPPLEAMESLLFSLIGLGFVFLTISLVGAFFFVSPAFWAQSPKGILSLLAWGFFALLLLGHYYKGWRGLTAVKWTLLGNFTLLLAYFGSKWITG